MNIPVKYLIQLGYDESGAIAYQRDLKRCEDATNKFGVQSGRAVEILDRKQNIFFNKQGKQVINTSYLWKDNFGKTFKTTLQEVGDDMNVVGVQVGSLGQKMKKSAGLSKEFTNALKRVTIVVPVWMIARNILQGVLQTLSSGMTYWKDFSNAITKAKQTFTDIKDVNMEAYIAGLTDRIRDLSIETGKTMAELVNTMYRFTTVGLSVQRAEEGMAEAVRLANLMFGNQDEIGRVIAQVYRLLGDNMADTIPEQKRMQVIGSQIYKLWKDNAFEIGELTQAYQKFLPTANVFNFSVTQSTALLATLETAALKSGRAGRLLRTSINKLAENSTQLAKEFGIVVTGGESTFDVLMKILGAVNKMDTAKFPIEKFRKFNLFGGVRSREAAMALSAAYELLKKNIDAINPSMDNLNKLLEEEKSAHDDVKESLGFQLKKLTNLRAQLGEAFIKGVVGAKSFKEAIVAYNSALENSQKLVSHIGDSLTTMLEVAYGLPIAFDMFFTMAKQNVEDFQTIYGNIGKAMKGSLPISEVERLISTIKSGAIDVSKLEILPGKSVEEKKTKILQALQTIVLAKKDIADKPIISDKNIKEYEASLKKIEEAKKNIALEKKGKELFGAAWRRDLEAEERIKKIIKDQNLEYEHQLKYIELEAKGADKVEIARAKIVDKVKDMVDIFNTSDKVQSGILSKLDEQALITATLKGDYVAMKAALLNVFTVSEDVKDSENDMLEIEKQRRIILKETVKEQYDLKKILINHELKLLKLRGANEKQILLMRTALEKNLDLTVDITDQFKRRAELQEWVLNTQQSATKKLISHELRLLRVRNASESTILETQIALEDAFGIDQDIISKLNKKLQLEEAVTEEKRNQNYMSSRAVKMYEIAQKYSESIALEIAKYQEGVLSFEAMGTAAQEVFKKEMPRQYKEYQAHEYFIPTYSYGGARYDWSGLLPETTTPDIFGMRNRIRRETERVMPKVEIKPTVPVNIKNEINIQQQAQETAKQIVNKIASELAKAIQENPELNRSLHTEIENY